VKTQTDRQTDTQTWILKVTAQVNVLKFSRPRIESRLGNSLTYKMHVLVICLKESPRWSLQTGHDLASKYLNEIGTRKTENNIKNNAMSFEWAG